MQSQINIFQTNTFITRTSDYRWHQPFQAYLANPGNIVSTEMSAKAVSAGHSNTAGSSTTCVVAPSYVMK